MTGVWCQSHFWPTGEICWCAALHPTCEVSFTQRNFCCMIGLFVQLWLWNCQESVRFFLTLTLLSTPYGTRPCQAYSLWCHWLHIKLVCACFNSLFDDTPVVLLAYSLAKRSCAQKCLEGSSPLKSRSRWFCWIIDFSSKSLVEHIWVWTW